MKTLILECESLGYICTPWYWIWIVAFIIFLIGIWTGRRSF